MIVKLPRGRYRQNIFSSLQLLKTDEGIFFLVLTMFLGQIQHHPFYLPPPLLLFISNFYLSSFFCSSPFFLLLNKKLLSVTRLTDDGRCAYENFIHDKFFSFSSSLPWRFIEQFLFVFWVVFMQIQKENVKT